MNGHLAPKSYFASAVVVIAVFSLLSKLAGVARDAILSHQFGASNVIDVYFASFRIPDFIFNLLILGTFAVAFIPVFSEYLAKDEEKANELAESIFTVALLAMLAFSLTALIFINPLVSAIAPGFTGETRELTKTFTQILLLSPIFLSLSSITSSILNAHKRFAIVALAPVIYNLSIILGVVWLYPLLGPAGLAWGVVLGAVLHFVIQIPQTLKTGFRFRLNINARDPGFIKFWQLYWPRIFSMGTGHINALVASIFGSFLGSGALAAFYYANNLQSVFLGIFAVSASLAVFPMLADLFNEKKETQFKNVLAKTTVQILYFIVPLSLMMLVLRAQIVRLVLGIGQNTNFTFDDTKTTAMLLGLLVISLFAQSLTPLYARAFYARQNTKIPVIISLITVFFNIIATYFGIKYFGVIGMAVAFSLTNAFNLVLLVGELHHKIGHIQDEYLVIDSLKILISSIFSSAACFLMLHFLAPFLNTATYIGIFIQTLFAGIIGAVLYLFISYVLGLDETRNLFGLLKGLWNKSFRVFGTILNFWS